jgi:hypothetical protein
VLAARGGGEGDRDGLLRSTDLRLRARVIGLPSGCGIHSIGSSVLRYEGTGSRRRAITCCGGCGVSGLTHVQREDYMRETRGVQNLECY